ncbi:MAG: hypothetical protein U0271_09565 [Polyangiaceae bacterium]
MKRTNFGLGGILLTTLAAALGVGCGDDSTGGGGTGATGGTGGSGGQGGTGVTTTTHTSSTSTGMVTMSNVGEPCEMDADCGDGGVCIPQVTSGWAKGYCTQPCMDDSECITGDTCNLDIQRCLHSCQNVGDCRAGYDCLQASQTDTSTTCIPYCSMTSDCAAPAECITDTMSQQLGLCIEAEQCQDTLDNDLDSLPDCADPDCAADAMCVALVDAACAASAPLVSPLNGTTVGGSALFASQCGAFVSGLGAEQIYSISVPGRGQLHVEATPIGGSTDLALYARATCADAATLADCSDDPQDPATTEVLDIGAQAAQDYTVFVDSYLNTTEGAFSLTATFTPAVCGDGAITLPETCDDSNEMDGDGCTANCDIDLAFYCAQATSIGLGATNGTTIGGTSLFEAPQDAVECAYGTGGGGNEKLYVFTPATSGMLTAALAPTGDYDMGLYARTSCADGATQIGCSDVNFTTGMQTESLTVPVTAGVPVTIFVDSYHNVGGAFTLTLSQN